MLIFYLVYAILHLRGATFDKIISNVKNIKKFDGRFLFRVSFDNNNFLHVKELLRYIKNLNISNDYQIYLAPIHQTTSQSEHSCSFCSKNTSENTEIMLNLYFNLYRYMKDLNIAIPKYFTNGPCMTVSADTVLIDPLGQLFKCVEMIGINELSVGNVKNLKYNQNIAYFTGHPNFKKCIEKKCKYVCLCGGGCLMKSYLKDKSLNNLDCQYKLFEKLTPFLLEMNYGNR